MFVCDVLVEGALMMRGLTCLIKRTVFRSKHRIALTQTADTVILNAQIKLWQGLHCACRCVFVCVCVDGWLGDWRWTRG